MQVKQNAPMGAFCKPVTAQSLRHDVDVDCRLQGAGVAPNFFCSKCNMTGRRSEQRVVAAASDVDAWSVLRASLSDDDAAGVDVGAVRHLDSQALRLGVSSKSGGAASFLMGHIRKILDPKLEMLVCHLSRNE